jgi:anaerobic ribonucleoside-triphosphate reductase activating protein
LLAGVDGLMAGRYVAAERVARGLRGSANKTIHLLTPRYSLADLEATPEAEVSVGPDGEISASGIGPLRLG